MPIYEYRCNNCRRIVNILVRGFSGEPDAICTECGSHDLTRLISKFSVLKTDHDRMESVLEDSALVRGMEQNDPRALAEWSRRMGQEGGTVGGPEYEDMMERLDRGEMPPELGGGGLPPIDE